MVAKNLFWETCRFSKQSHRIRVFNDLFCSSVKTTMGHFDFGISKFKLIDQKTGDDYMSKDLSKLNSL